VRTWGVRRLARAAGARVRAQWPQRLAPRAGLEPATSWLTGAPASYPASSSVF